MSERTTFRFHFGCALGAAALALVFGSAAQAQQFIYGNSAGNGMYKIDANTGVVAKACPQAKGNGRGMVIVGQIAFFTVANSGTVYKTNFNTCSDDGVAFTVPGATGLSTIAFDGVNFWIGDYSGSNKAYYVSPAGSLLKTITLPNCVSFCDGLEFFNGKLISNRGDASNSGYDVYDTQGTLVTSQLIAPTGYSGTGIAFDGTNFYVSDIFNQKLQVFNGTTGAFVKTVTITGMTLANVIEDLSLDYAIILGPPPTVQDVPTMSEWAMIVMSALLALLGIVMLRRRMR